MLSAHYRKPLNFGRKLLEQADNALQRLYNLKRNLEHYISAKKDMIKPNISKVNTNYDNYITRFEQAMDDDINTPEALAVLFDMVRDINSAITSEFHVDEAKKVYSSYLMFARILGLLAKQSYTVTDEQYINEMIEQREQARKEKNWGLADSIRDTLSSSGVILEDTSQGIRWRLKS